MHISSLIFVILCAALSGYNSIITNILSCLIVCINHFRHDYIKVYIISIPLFLLNLFGVNYYLQQTLFDSNSQWADSEAWFDNPIPVEDSNFAESFDNHNIFVNGYTLRSDNLNDFTGASLVMEGDSDIIDHLVPEPIHSQIDWNLIEAPFVCTIR